MSILTFMVLLVIGAVICLRISSNMEGRGTLLFWIGIVLIIIAVLIGIRHIQPIFDTRDERPYSTLLDPNYNY